MQSAVHAKRDQTSATALATTPTHPRTRQNQCKHDGGLRRPTRFVTSRARGAHLRRERFSAGRSSFSWRRGKVLRRSSLAPAKGFARSFGGGCPAAALRVASELIARGKSGPAPVVAGYRHHGARGRSQPHARQPANLRHQHADHAPQRAPPARCASPACLQHTVYARCAILFGQCTGKGLHGCTHAFPS